MAQERPERSFLYRRTGRRQLMRQALDGAAKLGFVVASGSALWYLINRAEKRSESLSGKPIEGKQKELYFTSPLPDEPNIPVRSLPELGDNIIGYVGKGHIVEGRAYNGRVYPGESGLGKFEGSDGDSYGKWFKVDRVPLYSVDQRGNLQSVRDIGDVNQKVVNGVYIAANGLKALSEQDYLTLFRQSKQEMLGRIDPQ